MNQEEKGMFLASAMTQYIFNKTFEEHNNGHSFDYDKWSDDIDKIIGSDKIFLMSKEKQEQLSNMLINLDDYAKQD